jgi:hypothetical protein
LLLAVKESHAEREEPVSLRGGDLFMGGKLSLCRLLLLL